MTEERFLQMQFDRSRNRARQLMHRNDRSAGPGRLHEVATRHPGWMIAGGLLGGFLVARAVSAMPLRGMSRIGGAVLGGTLVQLVQGLAVDRIAPDSD